MNADRFTIDTDGGIFIQHPFAANMTVPQMFEGAIRQQARDLEQLRADLAAAVAERDRLLRNEAGLLNSLKDSHNARFRLEARLAAIEAAPTVCVAHFLGGIGVPDGTELIARPAKE